MKIQLIFVLFFLTSCRNNEDKIKQNIEKYITENAEVLNDYKPISTEIIDTIYAYSDYFTVNVIDTAASINYENNNALDNSEFISSLSNLNLINYEYPSYSQQGDAQTKFYKKVYCDLTSKNLVRMNDNKFCKKILSDEAFRQKIYTLYSKTTPFNKNFEEFNGLIKSDTTDLTTLKKYIVKHKYRMKIKGENLLFEKKFEFDNKWQVVNNEYYLSNPHNN